MKKIYDALRERGATLQWLLLMVFALLPLGAWAQHNVTVQSATGGTVTADPVTGVTKNKLVTLSTRGILTNITATAGGEALPLSHANNLLVNGDCSSIKGWTVKMGEYGGDYHVVVEKNATDGYNFHFSRYWDKIYQTIDLMAKGFTVDQLDASPSFFASAQLRSEWGSGKCSIQVQALDASGNVLTFFDLVNDLSVISSWKTYEHVFTLPVGTRQLKYIVEGCDNRQWKGHYGPQFRNLDLSLGTKAPSDNWYYFFMPDADVTVTSTFNLFSTYVSEGGGTEDSPWMISSLEDWNKLVDYVAKGGETNGKFFKLKNSIEGITTMVGDDSNPFRGTFDGGGYTLTVNINATSENSGPFKNIDGATIKNLTTAGTVTSSAKCIGGLAGRADGMVTIENCHSMVTINSTVNGDGTHGGFIGNGNAKLTFKDCAFTGTIQGSSTGNCGGFVGWRQDNATVNLNNCIFAGKWQLSNTNECATFARNGVSNITNGAYYVNSVDKADWNQGTQVSATLQEGSINKVLSLFGTTYYQPNAVSVSVTKTVYPAGVDNTLEGYSLKEGNTVLTEGTDYTVSITNAANATVETINAAGDYTVTFTGTGNYAGSATVVVKALEPTVITTIDQWNTFAQNVTSGTNDYDGQLVKLGENIEGVTTMVGTSDHPFRGTFDGNGKTLTMSLTAVGENTAPFGYVDGTTIQNLKTAGTITTSYPCAAGIIGKVAGTVNITNCQSSVAITSTKSGDNTSGGLVAHGEANITFTDCAFTGSITGAEAECCGGFVGWRDGNGTINVNHCLFAGKMNIKSLDNCGTFARNGVNGTLTEAYYLNKVDKADWNQGTQVFAAPQKGSANGSIILFGNKYYFPIIEETDLRPTFVRSNCSGFNRESPSNLLDSNGSSTKWTERIESGDKYVICKTPKALVPLEYKITTANDTYRYSDRNWKSWKIYGANFNSDDEAAGDAAAWTLIDQKTDITTTSTPSFSNANTTASAFSVTGTVEANYSYYKIVVDAAIGTDLIQMSDFVFSKYAVLQSEKPEEGLYQIIKQGDNTYYMPVNDGIKSSYLYTGEDISVAPVIKDYKGNTIASDNYQFTISKDGSEVSAPNAMGEYTMVIQGMNNLGGSQTYKFRVSDADLIITSKDEWDAFAGSVTSGTDDYSDKYVRLDANIEGITTPVGDASHTFKGTFDGNGHKITVNITAKASPANDDEKGWAPFRFTDGATIKNLWTAGTITCPNGSNDLSAGGIIGRTIGENITTLSNCRSSVVIDMSAQTSDRDFTAGGLIGCTHRKGATIENCLFDGTMKGSHAINNGGIVGWATNEVTISNTVQAGTFTTSTSGCGTFSRNAGNVNLSNCYYLNAYGSDNSFKSGKPTQLTSDNVATAMASLPSDYWMYDEALSYPQLKMFPTTKVVEIAGADDWNAFVSSIDAGISYKGATVTMTDNVSDVVTMVGSEAKPFKGIFDGNGKTLEVNISGGPNEMIAPFRYVSGATIKNMKVTGTVTSAANHTCGLVGSLSGNVTIDNVEVAATVNNTNGGHAGGFIGHAQHATATISNSAFTGTLTASQNGAYFVGWGESDCTANVSNSLANPASKPTAGNIWDFVCTKQIKNKTVTNCFYNQATATRVNSGENQGTQTSADALADGTTVKGLQGNQATEMWIVDPTNVNGTTLKTFAKAAEKTIDSDGYSSYYNSVAWTVPTGLTVKYVNDINIANMKVEWTTIGEGETVPAGTAVIMNGESNKKYTLTFVRQDAPEAPADNYLHGSDLGTTPEANDAK